MPTPTGLFERNGHYYLRLIIPASVGHKARMCPAYALGDGLGYALEKPFAKYFLAANELPQLIHLHHIFLAG